jgi:hypothetical protein
MSYFLYNQDVIWIQSFSGYVTQSGSSVAIQRPFL